MSESARFREDLIQAVDYGLMVPVELVRAATYERIERKCPFPRDETSENLETSTTCYTPCWVQVLRTSTVTSAWQ